MNKIILSISVLMVTSIGTCFGQLTKIINKSPEQIAATYTISKDVSYGADGEQKLDIYLSAEAKQLGRKNFTVVFLHGGGYYLSDKSSEERYIQPYLQKGLNVVNMNYRIKRGIPVATEDLSNALNFLKANNATYQLNLNKVVLTGFSAGAHIASLQAVTANNAASPVKRVDGVTMAAVINFSGPVGGLAVVEKVFMDNDVQIMKEIGNALFPDNGYATGPVVTKYEPITYFDKSDPPFFLWQGQKDEQVPPVTFEKFKELLNKNTTKNTVLFLPEGAHSPNTDELKNAYLQIFIFLDKL